VPWFHALEKRSRFTRKKAEVGFEGVGRAEVSTSTRLACDMFMDKK
jgi:hypothetical protein